jgi:hypothetical protein
MTWRRLVCVVALITLPVLPSQGKADVFNPNAFLLKHCGFSKGELAQVGRGEVVSRSLDAESSEVAICAAVQIAVPLAFYLERFRDIEWFKRSENVLQVGRFSNPPAFADLASLTFATEEASELSSCRPGHCNIKLDTAGIERVRSAAAGSARPAAGGAGAAGGNTGTSAVTDAVKRHMAEYVRNYLAQGNTALMVYRDHDKPASIAEALQRIVQRSPYLPSDVPALNGGVASFSGALPAGVESFVYWSTEQVGPRGVTTMTHVLIGDTRDGLTPIASKQIYANHYFTASLGLTLLADVSQDAAKPRLSVVYVNRSRVDLFGGLLGPFKRTLVRSRARSGAEDMMRKLADRLTRDFRGRG